MSNVTLCMALIPFALMILVPLHLAFAEEITMYADQTEYYFTIGEDAIIRLEIENSLGQEISGMLQYTITQKIQQANMQISNTNTQASSFTVNDGNQTVSLEFGTVDSPSTLVANLNFSYNDPETLQEMNVSLGPISIYFVADESQKNNTQNKMQSSSQQGSSSSSQLQNNQQQQQQSLQQRLDEMLNQSNPQSQDPQQRLQNNQVAQDSTVLKQEIQEQIQEENRLQKEFEEHVVAQEEFQKLHQQLIEDGYEITQGSLNPTSDSTGDFEVNYENKQGEWANIQGSIEEGDLTDIQKQTQKERENLLSILREDPTFQEYEEQLDREGFVEQDWEFVYDKDDDEKTSISIRYQDQNILNATIHATFVDERLIEISLDKPRNDTLWWAYILTISTIVIGASLLSKKFRKKTQIPEKPEIKEKIKPEALDHIAESQSLIKGAKDDFESKKYNDAYGKVNQAIRLFLSYELNLNQEITNENLLEHIVNTTYPVNEIEDCFRLSSMIEFAKGTPNKEEFDKMISLAENLIEQRDPAIKEKDQ